MHAAAAAVIDSFPKLILDSGWHCKAEPFCCCEGLETLISFLLENRCYTLVST